MRERLGAKVTTIVVLILLLAGFSEVVRANGLTVHVRRDIGFEKSHANSWAVALFFNHLVFPSNLIESVQVTVNGVQAKFEVRDKRGTQRPTKPGRSFIIVPSRAQGEQAEVKITVKKGLSDATGRLLLAADFVYQFMSIETITVSGISTFYRSKKDKGLLLVLSRHVSENDLSKAIEITPEVPNLTIAREGYRQYRIEGDFEYDKDYQLKIAPLRLASGREVLGKRVLPFKGPGLKPEASPKTERSVVELLGRQLFPLKVSNLTKIRCRLKRVPPYFLPEIQKALGKTDGIAKLNLKEQVRGLNSFIDSGKVAPVFGGTLVEDSEVFFAPQAKGRSVGYSLPLSFRTQPEHGGAWIITLSDPDGGSESETHRLIQITDLSVSYKQSPNSLLVWVTSIYSGTPVPGVEVFLSSADGTRFFVGKTNRDGLLLLKDGQKYQAIEISQGKPVPANVPLVVANIAWVVAATQKDSCGVNLDSYRLKPFAVTQAEHVKDEPDALRGAVFTERGVYRPGATVHFKYVSRAYRTDRIVAPVGEEVSVEIVGPRGDVNYSKKLKLGEFGSCYDSFPTKKFFPVGTYTIRVKPAKEGQKLSSNTTFMIQDFKRARHYATVSVKPISRPSKAFVGLQREEEFLDIEVAGHYYTGGPVKHGKVRWKATLVPVSNKVEGLSAYFFGNEDEETRFLESGESTLDRNGKIHLNLPLDSRLLTGIYGVRISATVLDIDGEPATEVETYNPKPKFLVGISGHPPQVQSGFSAPLNVVVADSNGKKISSGMVEATVMELDSFYVEKRDQAGNINYLWEQGWMKKFTSTVPIVNGQATFQVNLNNTGKHMIAFTYEAGGNRYTSQTVFQVGWQGYDEWLQSHREQEVRTSRQVLLSTTKKEYSVGEAVEVQFQTPRPVKKCLVTLERGRVFEAKVIDIKKGTGTYRFTVKEDFLPNVYVSVIAAAGREGFPVYQTQADTDIPIVYYGYADVSVTSKTQKLSLDIAPEAAELKGRPAENKTLTFKVTDQKGKGVRAEMAVCVVDEAVLALTRFKTPTLTALARFNIPLSVFSGDLRLALVSQDLYRIFSTRPLTGGGAGLGEVSPSLRKDFRPVAYFNPAVLTDDSGLATVAFKLPDTTTAYRVYAVVCDKGAGFVSGQRNMVVTKEFFVEPSIPRFLIPGDRVTFPVVLHNKTKEKGDFSLTVESVAPLKVDVAESSGTLDPWSTLVVKSTAKVTSGTRNAQFLYKGTFTGKSGRYADAIEKKCPILSRYLPVNRVQIGAFTRRGEIRSTLPESLKSLNRNDLNPTDFAAHLCLDTTSWSKIAPGLKYLVRYPFGCVEQTSSGVIPLAGIRGLIQSRTIPGIKADKVDTFLKAGVERLLSMQVPSGGFAYWPGQQFPSWWGTMYATFALTAAQQAGYDVPPDRMKKALEYLRKNLFEKDADHYHGSAWTKELALFNLAMGKQLSAQELEQFFQNYDGSSQQSKALMLLAAKQIGFLPDKEIQNRVRRLDPRYDPKRTSYYDSSFREIAVCLLAATKVGGTDKKADEWAGYLLRGLRPEGRWYSTADTGWCLLALSTYFKDKESGKPKNVKITIDYAGKDSFDVTMSNAAAYIAIDPLKLLDAGKINLTSNSRNLINYTLELTYPDIITDPSQLTRGFTLRKKMENLNGKEEIRVGDVVRVTLELNLRDPNATYSGKQFDYLALVDPVPAGLVPINSELKSEGAESDERNRESLHDNFYNFTPSFFEFRDDAVRVFKNRGWSGLYRYSYLARAVAEGDFWMRGSRISLMYDPAYFGRTKGRRVTILPAK